MSIQSFTADALNTRWSFAELAGSIMERFSTRRAVRMRRRTVRNELLDYSPQQLAELRISEDDIDFVAEDFYRA